MPLPLTLGREGSGTVVECGSNVIDFKPNDKVAFFSGNAYADYVSIESSTAYKLPDNFSTRDAATATLQGLTAHYLSHSIAPLKESDFVLVHAAAGGTGALLVQMCKLRGLNVIATVGSNDKGQIARDAGADFIINYKSNDFEHDTMKITQNKGCAAVFDGVGLSTYQKSLNCTARRGMLCLYGNASGAVPPVDPLILSKGSKFMCRPTLMDFISTNEERKERCDELFNWIAQGNIKLRVAAEFNLEEAAKAHQLLESRATSGKILLDCRLKN